MRKIASFFLEKQDLAIFHAKIDKSVKFLS